jgi:hypothetical protein
MPLSLRHAPAEGLAPHRRFDRIGQYRQNGSSGPGPGELQDVCETFLLQVFCVGAADIVSETRKRSVEPDPFHVRPARILWICGRPSQPTCLIQYGPYLPYLNPKSSHSHGDRPSSFEIRKALPRATAR